MTVIIEDKLQEEAWKNKYECQLMMEDETICRYPNFNCNMCPMGIFDDYYLSGEELDSEFDDVIDL